MKGAALLLLIAGVAFASVVGYHIEPVKAIWSGLTPRGGNVAQTVTCNFDSLSYVELFAGAKGNGGVYTAAVIVDGQQVMSSNGTQDWDCRWVRFDSWDYHVAFTKGKTVTIRFTRGGADSIEYYYQSGDPYRYGMMIDPNWQGPVPIGLDLACRVDGRMNPTDSSYFGVDDCNFVRWWSQDSMNRIRKRDSAAALAESAGIGTIMVYAVWPQLVGGNDTTLSWSEFDAHLWEVESAHSRPVVDI
jgi:hypothetical protein